MSGGHFNYNQYRIRDIIDALENELIMQGEDIPIEERRYPYVDDNLNYYKHPLHPKSVQAAMIKGLEALDIAFVYVQEIDWYLSGDNGEEEFLEGLRRELKSLIDKDYEKNYKIR